MQLQLFLSVKKGEVLCLLTSKPKRRPKKLNIMLDEVSMSIAIAYKLCDLLERYDIPMEVHADINTDPQFQSNVALKEAMGYIMGMGYEFKAKPHAFASSNCANKIVQ